MAYPKNRKSREYPEDVRREMRTYKISDKEILSLYHELRGMTRVAKRIGCAVTTVSTRLAGIGQRGQFGKGPRPHCFKLDPKKVVSCCRSSFTMREAGDKLGIGPKAVHAYLDRLGLQPQKILKKKPKKPKKQNPLIRCACGCGKKIRKYSPGGHERRYIKGHNGRKKRPISVCAGCGSSFTQKRCHYTARYCSWACAGKHRLKPKKVSELHWNWQGGISKEPYPFGWQDDLKGTIRKRDSHRCRLCGKKYKRGGRRFPVHHIDYDKENLDPRNLLTLCGSCHGKTNGGNRRHWTRFLGKKMRGVA